MGDFGIGAIILIACLAILVIIPSIAFAIADIVVAATNWNITCDDTSFIALPVWMVVSGSLTLTFWVILIPMIALGAVFGIASLIVGVAVVLIVMGLFNFAWSIVGAVALFQYSGTCMEQTPLVWGFVLATLILMWLSILSSFFSRRAVPN